MSIDDTYLTKQEKTWIEQRRVIRLYDQREVQIYPMGAERFLASALSGNQPNHYNIRKDIEGKHVLVVPGHGNSGFLIAQAGAQSVTIYDKDPVTIAWMKAFKKYYHYREYDAQNRPQATVGELFSALTCWYPPLVRIPGRQWAHYLLSLVQPNVLRRAYIHYLVALVQKAIQAKTELSFELQSDIDFHVGTVDTILDTSTLKLFDSAFIPYLLGVAQGIEDLGEIVQCIKGLTKLIPHGSILVTPSRNTRDFYCIGKRYFVTTAYSDIEKIPNLHLYCRIEHDKYWFRNQGLIVFRTVL